MVVLRGFRQAPSLRPQVLLFELPRVQSRHMYPYPGAGRAVPREVWGKSLGRKSTCSMHLSHTTYYTRKHVSVNQLQPCEDYTRKHVSVNQQPCSLWSWDIPGWSELYQHFDRFNEPRPSVLSAIHSGFLLFVWKRQVWDFARTKPIFQERAVSTGPATGTCSHG